MTPDLPDPIRVALLVIDALDAMHIAYHIGGSYASSVHGTPRQTQDIDLVVELGAEQAAALVSALSREFYGSEISAREAVAATGSFDLIHLDSAIKIVIFVRGSAPLDLEEFRDRKSMIVMQNPERRVFVKPAEDTLLRKLQRYRLGGEISDRQWSDVTGIVRTQRERLDREYLRRWSETLGVDDLLAPAMGGP